jgi:hypothetical protein
MESFCSGLSAKLETISVAPLAVDQEGFLLSIHMAAKAAISYQSKLK